MEVNIPFAPVFMVGTLAECLALPNTFKSVLTPEDYEGENNAEGLVIEPVEPAWFNNGSRIYFKNKTESFTEKKPKEVKVFELSEAESALMNELLTYNTEQRVSNVISKIGQVTNKDFGKILGLTVQDIFEEFTKETERDPKVEAENNWKQFVKLLQAEVGKTVRSEFLKVLE
jgi:Rnl2 family RNA ligase